MKRVSLAALFGILFILTACPNVQSASDVPRISKDELKAKLGSPDLVLLDVRSRNDWESSGEKIAGAVRMDPGNVDSWAGTLPRHKEIVLYCT